MGKKTIEEIFIKLTDDELRQQMLAEGLFIEDKEDSTRFFYPVEFDFSEYRDILVPKVKAYVKSGDEGCGRPGSLLYNLTLLKQATYKTSIVKLVKDVCNKTLDVKSSKSRLIAQAEKALKEHYND